MSSGDFVEGSGAEAQPVIENIAIVEVADFVKYICRVVTLHFEEEVTPPAFQNALQESNNQVGKTSFTISSFHSSSLNKVQRLMFCIFS